VVIGYEEQILERRLIIDGVVYDWTNHRFLDQDIIGFFNIHRWLSNFWNQEVNFGNIKFPNAEAAYQAAKSEDKEVWKQFSKLQTGQEAKKLGRTIKMRSDWETIKLNVMKQVVHQKFQNHWLRLALLSTEHHHLEEANTWGDIFWGTVNREGQNHLGKILMAERTKLQAKGTTP